MEEVSYQLTDSELYKGLVAVAKSRVVTRILRIVGMVLIGVIIFATTVTLRSGVFTVSPGYVLTVALGIYAYFLPEISARMQVNTLKNAKNPLTLPLDLRIRQHDYIIKNSSFSQRSDYDKLYAIEENNDFFLLRVSEGSAHIIPKRVLNPEGVARFREILGSVQGPKIKLQQA